MCCSELWPLPGFPLTVVHLRCCRWPHCCSCPRSACVSQARVLSSVSWSLQTPRETVGAGWGEKAGVGLWAWAASSWTHLCLSTCVPLPVGDGELLCMPDPGLWVMEHPDYDGQHDCVGTGWSWSRGQSAEASSRPQAVSPKDSRLQVFTSEPGGLCYASPDGLPLTLLPHGGRWVLRPRAACACCRAFSFWAPLCSSSASHSENGPRSHTQVRNVRRWVTCTTDLLRRVSQVLLTTELCFWVGLSPTRRHTSYGQV